MNKNRSGAFYKASLEMLENAKKAIKEKYKKYENTEDEMNYMLDSVAKAENEVVVDAKRNGVTKNDVCNAQYRKPNGYEVEKYKRHLEKRGITDEEVHDKKFDNKAKKNGIVEGKNHGEKNYEIRLDIEPMDDISGNDTMLLPSVEPILTNRFCCELSFGDTVIESYLIQSFSDSVVGNSVILTFYLDEKNVGLSDKIEKVYREQSGGKLSFQILSPDGITIKKTDYEIANIVLYDTPTYTYEKSKPAIHQLILNYIGKCVLENGDWTDITLSNTNEQDNDYPMREEKPVCSEKSILKDSTNEENSPIRNVKKRLDEHILDILLSGGKPWAEKKYEEIFTDIEDKTHPSVIVCSRQCGMTTHLIAYYLAKISKEKNYYIWFVTPNLNGIENIFYNIINDELRETGCFKFAYNSNENSIEAFNTNSKIIFMSTSQNIENVIIGKRCPNEIVYNDMAFIPSNELNPFLDAVINRVNVNQFPIKEVCVSTPSKKGSVFNFIALISNHTIKLPWSDIDNNKLKGIIVNYSFEDFQRQFACHIPDEDDNWLEITN